MVRVTSEDLLPIITEAKKIQVSETGAPVTVSTDARIVLTDGISDAAQGTLLVSARAHRIAGDVALFGAHVWTKEEYAASRKVQAYTMLEISREGLQEVTDAVMAYVRQWQSFRLVVHMDALDLAFGGKYPGGFSSRELLYVVQRLRLIKTLATVEIVVDEMNDALVKVAAHLLAELS